jgi:hypothetical protein
MYNPLLKYSYILAYRMTHILMVRQTLVIHEVHPTFEFES